MRLVAIGILLSIVVPAEAEKIADSDAAMLRCAQEVFAGFGEEVWPGWSKAPFPILLIGKETEFLISERESVPGLTKSNDARFPGVFVLQRPRTFPPHLQATFPAFGSEPVIVIGTATGQSPAAWMFTVLHEHFHQLQYSQPWYYTKTQALNLARGDESGMWMLNFPFPYSDPSVQERYAAFNSALASALRSRGTSDFAPALRGVKSRWRALRESLDEDDYKYLRFQMWQEGVARYVELESAHRTARGERSRSCPAAMQQNAGRVAGELMDEIYRSLDAPRLGEQQRVAFYSSGAAVAMLLDETSPDWKETYMRAPFALEEYFAP